MGNWLDLPPIWLLGFMVLAVPVARWLDWPGDIAAWRWIGRGLIGAGLLLMALAALRMTQARTTVIPHRQPAALVTGGVFAFSRNPIYLGDALVLAGWCLTLGSLPALVLVPVFMVIITARFIRPEEARLAAGFGPDFARWAKKTRRWL